MPLEYHRLLLLFVDGIGLDQAGPANPFSASPSPAFNRLLGGSLTSEQIQAGPELLLATLDATLAVEGLPQSATGQTTLFTGINAAQRLGRHVTAFPGPELREIIREHSVFRRAREAGLEATFANAYTKGYLSQIEAGTARRSVTTCAVEAADIPFRTMTDLEAGRAATFDIERDLVGERTGVELETVPAHSVGCHLAGLARDHRLTAFETFLPDLEGHGRLSLGAGEVVRRLDDLVGGVLESRSKETTVLLTSDHGNFENTESRTHTRCPVPLLAVGPAACEFASLESLGDVTPKILDLLR